MQGLAGRRILVVGASTGIGRSIARMAAAHGARVVASARRAGLLDSLVADAPGQLSACPGDVATGAGCRALAEQAADGLGGLDWVVYAAGQSPLDSLSSMDEGQWHRLLATNTVGAALTVAACLPHLRAGSGPTVALLSSHSVGTPWPGLSAYAASKAALDEIGLGLRAEEPWLRVVRVAVGPTLTPFADGWESERAGQALNQWAEAGLLRHRVLEPEEVATAVLNALCAGPDDLSVVGEEELPAGPR